MLIPLGRLIAERCSDLFRSTILVFGDCRFPARLDSPLEPELDLHSQGEDPGEAGKSANCENRTFMIKKFIRFKSISARIGVSVYALVVLWLFGKATLNPSSDAGEWIAMDFLYWPLSKAVHPLRNLMKDFVSSDTLHTQPFRSVTFLNLFDVLSALIIGGLWCFLIIKIMHFAISCFRKRDAYC